MEAKSVLEMARGAIAERADYEMDRIIKNILDPNTKAEKKRTLTPKATAYKKERLKPCPPRL